MALKTYKQKRNFKHTPEPEAVKKSSSQELIFVIQEHDASHLHYDFRLEMEGVLKSWAVPKGPSMNPEDKRLAMMVEDHPYSYKDFEGTIPEGNYGAGNVIVWDNGTYHAVDIADKKTTEKKLLAGLKKGHISFILKGKKLKGEFSLIRIKDENTWLLHKKKDKYASDTDILKKDRSVISRKKLVLRDRKHPVKKTERVKTVPKKKSKKAGPEISQDQLKPMMASLAEGAFDDPNWIFEKKYDGYRALAFINKGEVDLISRNQLSFNKLFAPLIPELKKIEATVVLDGEVVVEDAKGNSSFQLLQNYQNTGKGKLKYYIFDILHMDGHDLRQLTLLERKELLKLLLKNHKLKSILFSAHTQKNGKAFYDKATKQKLEGIIAKKSDGFYNSGKRSRDWLKIKITQEEEAVIAGITEPRGSRKHFGSLILGAYSGHNLRYIGNCGTGFSEQTLKSLYKQLVPLFRDASPFEEKLKFPEKVQWVKPEIVCQVKFTEWTHDNHMRHPVFLGIRIDKEQEDVSLNEMTKKGKNTKIVKKRKDIIEDESNFDITINGTVLHLSNQKKIYFPKDKIAKGEIVNYYKEIAPVILPYLRERPQSMNRFPNGINGPSFFQKDVDRSKSPDWINTQKIYSSSNKKYIDYLICNDQETLVYMANLGCIEINPWNSQIQSLEYPDWAVIDLDPEAIAFQEVVKTALEVKKLMDELETECYCKTSGASGLHIYIPLAQKYDYDIVKTFAELIAQTVFSRIPSITSIIRSPKKRQKKVYLDFLQNRKGQTLAAPYSVRPKPGATVSTPLDWKELTNKLSPSDFTIRNIFKRLDKKGDLWKPVLGKGVNILSLLKKLNKE